MSRRVPLSANSQADEDDEAGLGELRRLERMAGDRQPALGAVDLGAEQVHGEHAADSDDEQQSEREAPHVSAATTARPISMTATPSTGEEQLPLDEVVGRQALA